MMPPDKTERREETMGTPHGLSRRRILSMSAAAGSFAIAGGYRGAVAQAAKRIERLDPALDQIVSTSEPIVDLATNLWRHRQRRGSDDWKTVFFCTRTSLGSFKVKIAGVPVPTVKKS
jgi:hypothetical protein